MRFPRQRLPFVIATVVTVLMLLLVGSGSAEAQDKSYYWDQLDADITVQENGDFRVIETHTYVFTSGTFQTGVRDIPLDRVENITDIQVSEGDRVYTPNSKAAYGYTTVRPYPGTLRIQWTYPDTTNATRTFQLAYTVIGGIGIYEGGDQLFWKAVFPDHPQPIRSSKVTVHLPGAFPANQLKIEHFGFDATQSRIVDGSTAEFTAQNIPPDQMVEVFVQFPHGMIPARVPGWQTAEDQLRQQENIRGLVNLAVVVLALLLLLAGMIGLYILWYTRGRDRETGPALTYISEPPSSLPPGLPGTLLDEKADLRDILATVIDLARRGVMQMTEVKHAGFLGIGASQDFTFKLIGHTDDLLPYERALIKAMFGGKHEVELSDLQNHFYRKIPDIQTQMYNELVRLKYFSVSPQSTRQMYVGLGVAALIASIVFCIGALIAFGGYAGAIVLLLFVGIIISAGLMILGAVMPRKTLEGSQAAAQWRTFKSYLANIDKYMDLKQAQDLFDKYLPYAIAFGLERGFVRKFEAVNTPAPGWYTIYPPIYPGYGHYGGIYGQPGTAGGGAGNISGPGGLSEGGGMPSLQQVSEGMGASLQNMSNGLFNMLNSASSTFTSTPAPSGGRGGGGGGWSGGGGVG
ncbi:MAG: DUF2207 domain-containing protein [Chloroflexi bacterium]|nr:DUF2207 domain-containing protein [Chloroflexota bacterium]